LAANYPHLVQTAILLAGGGAISTEKSGLLRYKISNLRFMPRRWRIRAQRATLYAPGNEICPELVYRHRLRAVRRQFAALRTPLEEIWRPGPTPILWVHGEADVLVPLEIACALRDQFPDQVTLVVIPGAAHALIPEQPEAVLEAIVGFLRQHVIPTA
jgi:pimeloyl-ACP methyl ester carboxylesterase